MSRSNGRDDLHESQTSEGKLQKIFWKLDRFSAARSGGNWVLNGSTSSITQLPSILILALGWPVKSERLTQLTQWVDTKHLVLRVCVRALPLWMQQAAATVLHGHFYCYGSHSEADSTHLHSKLNVSSNLKS